MPKATLTFLPAVEPFGFHGRTMGDLVLDSRSTRRDAEPLLSNISDDVHACRGHACGADLYGVISAKLAGWVSQANNAEGGEGNDGRMYYEP